MKGRKMLFWGDFKTKVKVVIYFGEIYERKHHQCFIDLLSLSCSRIPWLTCMHTHGCTPLTVFCSLTLFLTLLDPRQLSYFPSCSPPKLSLLTFLPIAFFSRDSFPFCETRKPILPFGRHSHILVPAKQAKLLPHPPPRKKQGHLGKKFKKWKKNSVMK